METASRRARCDGQVLLLTVREMAVLEFLLRHKNNVVTRTRLAQAVWEENLAPMSNTIDFTVCHLREKADRGFARPLIHAVRGRGFPISASPP